MAFTKQVHRVSIAMVMSELKDQAETVTDARNAYRDAVADRDALMVELKAAGIPERNIMKLTGLSRDSVARITQGARTAVALDAEAMLSINPSLTVRSTP